MEFEVLTEALIEIFSLPIAIMLLSTVFRIVKAVMQGVYLGDLNDKIEKKENELIKEEKPQKINIDKDLEKYFNYKEEKK